MSDEQRDRPQGTPQGHHHHMQIQADAPTSLGVYANLMMVSHRKEEFILDFLFAQPQQTANGETVATLRSRIVTTPEHAKRIVRALQALERDRLDEVLDEAGLPASSNVVLHPVPGQRDPSQPIVVAQPPHQVEAASIGETEVRYDEVESVRLGGRSRGIITARNVRMSSTQVGCIRNVAR